MEPVRGRFWERDVLMWLPDTDAKVLLNGVRDRESLSDVPHRMHFYTSVVGSGETRDEIGDNLWHLGFQPTVLQKGKGRPSKGVDIALTCDMLSHASLDNYDVAVLIAGDGDYVPLVDEVKRLGKLVHLVFFQSTGLNPKLRRASDTFYDVRHQFEHCWRNYSYPVQRTDGLQTPDGRFNYVIRVRRESDNVKLKPPISVEFAVSDRRWVAPIDNAVPDVASLNDQALFELWYESCPPDLKRESTQARENDA